MVLLPVAVRRVLITGSARLADIVPASIVVFLPTTPCVLVLVPVGSGILVAVCGLTSCTAVVSTRSSNRFSPVGALDRSHGPLGIGIVLRISGLSILRDRRASPARIGVGTLMGSAVGSGAWVVSLAHLLSAISCAGGRAARVGTSRWVVALAVVGRAVGSVSGRGGAIVTAVPGRIAVIRSPVIHHRRAVPATVPTAVPPAATTAAHHRSHGDSGTECKNTGRHDGGCAISRGHHGCAVNDRRVVLRNIHNLRTWGLNHDNLRRLLHHTDLRAGFEIAGRLGFGTQGLNRSHHVGRLVVVSLAQRGSPA